jgi:hypothetical protein
LYLKGCLNYSIFTATSVETQNARRLCVVMAICPAHSFSN